MTETAIFVYTRADAIRDGELVDVSAAAREVGFIIPVALTRAAWNRYVLTHNIPGQDEAGRLWDLLWMLRLAARAAPKTADRISFRFLCRLPSTDEWQHNEAREQDVPVGVRLVTLESLCHPGDDAEPVITVMIPGED